MAKVRRFAVREAAEVTFEALAAFGTRVAGDKIVTLKTLKTSGVETTGETVYARGGRGNAKLVGFSSNREARLTLEDAIFDTEALAMITGNDISYGAKTVERIVDLQVNASNAVVLSEAVADETGMKPYLLESNKENIGTGFTKIDTVVATGQFSYDNSTKTVQFHTDIAQDTWVRVYYKATTGGDASSIKVSSDKFGQTFKVTLDVLVKDEETKNDYAAQIIVPTAKFEDSFSFSFSADGDPSALTLPLEILKPSGSTDMWEMVIYDANDIVV